MIARAVRVACGIALTPLVAVCALALWFDGPPSRGLAGALAATFAATCVGVALLVRPGWRAGIVVALLVAVVAGWWVRIEPRNDRDWLPDVARPPQARIEGDRVTIENVRDFRYRTESDWDERWETRTWDLGQLEGVDLFLSQWDSPLIVHTIVSWRFADAPPLAISIETRKEKGEEYSAVRGFFRQFELYYVVADERDVIALRAGPRGERVRLYHVRMTPAEARDLLLDYLREVNELAVRPRWYNALSHNCTTTIRQHVRVAVRDNPWSWKILANGYLDELMYERGTIDTSLPFAELRAHSDVTERAREAPDAPDFSQRLRAGLPLPGP